jgi:hypothetical protein
MIKRLRFYALFFLYRCQNIPASFKCTCFNGAPFDPVTKRCGGAVACTSNNQCPGNAICNGGSCTCPEPNVGPNCEDPCDTATCFPNAQCFVQASIPMCRCLPGFQLLPVQRACIGKILIPIFLYLFHIYLLLWDSS